MLLFKKWSNLPEADISYFFGKYVTITLINCTVVFYY